VLAAIALGGALGAPARYAVAELVGPSADGFPWATFWTNVIGSLALGFVLVVVLHRFPASQYLRPFVATGFLGSFTTFSTVLVETDLLVDHGRLDLAAAYVVASLVVGIAATAVGMAGGRLVPSVDGAR
jgi:CrcB protein